MSVSVAVTGTLRAQEHGHQPVVAFAQNQLGEVRTGAVAGTLNTNSNASGRNAPLIYDARGNGDGKIACTITGDHEGRMMLRGIIAPYDVVTDKKFVTQLELLLIDSKRELEKITISSCSTADQDDGQQSIFEDADESKEG